MGWKLVLKGTNENIPERFAVDELTQANFISYVRANPTRNTYNQEFSYFNQEAATLYQYYNNLGWPSLDALAYPQDIGGTWANIQWLITLNSNNGGTDRYIAGCYTGWYGVSCELLDISTMQRVSQLTGSTASSYYKAGGYMFSIVDDMLIVGVVWTGRLYSNVVDVKITAVNVTNYCNNNHFDIPETTVFSDEYGTPSDTGGYTGGTFDDSSDVISLPAMPTIGVTSAGFVNVYNPSVGDLQNFGTELFPDLTFTPSSPVSGSLSVSDAIEAMANALVDLGNQIPNIVNMYINSNLIQYVIDCHILPVAPTQGASEQIKVGFRQFSISSPKVTSDYVDFDCGSLSIGEYYANFIDYAPYTHAKLFLPFVGFVDLAPEFWQSGTVQIIYRFNIIDGSFMAFVLSTSSKSKLTNSVIMQFGGNACVHIPITGLNYSSMVSGVVSGASAVISQSSGGSLPASAVSGIKESITQASAVMQNKPPLQQSNGYNATTSFLSVRKPYLLIERSVSNFSMNYPEEKGIPSNITADFSALSGYTQSTNIHLDGITGATEEELNELSRLLQEGVIL